MIFLTFIFFSCRHRPKEDVSLHHNNDIVLRYSISKAEESALLNDIDLQINAQGLWLRGLRTYNVDDFIQARASAFSCLQEKTGFSMDLIDKNRSKNIRFPNEKTKTCRRGYASEVIPLNISSRNIACSIWAVLSWSKLNQWYQLPEMMLGFDTMFFLTAWLLEQEKCVDSPWVQFAILSGLLNIPNTLPMDASWNSRSMEAEKRLKAIENDPNIGLYVRVWYIKHRLLKGDCTDQEKSEWIIELQREQQIHPEINDLLKMLR